MDLSYRIRKRHDSEPQFRAMERRNGATEQSRGTEPRNKVTEWSHGIELRNRAMERSRHAAAARGSHGTEPRNRGSSIRATIFGTEPLSTVQSYSSEPRNEATEQSHESNGATEQIHGTEHGDIFNVPTKRRLKSGARQDFFSKGTLCDVMNYVIEGQKPAHEKPFLINF